MRVSEVMTREVVMVHSTDTILHAIQLMRARRVRCVFVERQSKEDRYGMLSETDVCNKIVARGLQHAINEMTVADIMTKPLIVIKDPNMNIEAVAQLFERENLHRAPVIVNDLLGVVSKHDLVRAVVQSAVAPPAP
eukprot:gnl/Trimastix_PCT/2054.p1 GENE.gnl/Trimastix_PCT/2054~~gnl/Trimastix_PCT/2054.p1  ORF type:complete len:136 (-),score=20.52 gnl/Trimastix_PCT/2054:69-476(-)